MQSFISRHRVVLLHIFFWCIYISFLLYQITTFNYRRNQDFEWLRTISLVSVQIFFTLVITYLNYFFFLPRFLRSKNVWRYLIELFVPFILLITARIYIQRYLVDGFAQREGYFYSSIFVVQVIAITLFIVIFVGLLRFAADWFELEAKRRAIENEKLTAELNFLKAQVNPHFLFNTLNNLYYLAYTQSPKTTEVIAKLSQMMRYMIYDSNHERVLLSQEIEYMKNYISLEQMRLSKPVNIQFNVRGNPEDVFVVPLVFITFLENAFKHGIGTTTDDAFIYVDIQLTGRDCLYRVENSKVINGAAVATGKGGIGLQNVKRRLELCYPGRHTLTIDNMSDVYKVVLSLNLN